MEFLGPCGVCGKTVRNYRALGQHLRFQSDPQHAELHQRWLLWRDTYRATLRCRKCGSLWEIHDKALRNQKRCSKCEGLLRTVGKRKYEKVVCEPAPDPRRIMTALGSKAQWDGLINRHVVWTPGDDLYREVVLACGVGEKVTHTLRRLGIPYKAYKNIMQDALGDGGYSKVARGRIRDRTIRMAHKAHLAWAALSPDEKAQRLNRFKKGSLLEKALGQALTAAGVSGIVFNVWQSLRFGNKWCPREADLKIPVGDGRKVIVLCDGEAFHGPGFIYGDPQLRIQEDHATARAYFEAGYSVTRYSESEIKSGQALNHLLGVLGRLGSCQRILRWWYPLLEEVV